MTGVGDGIVSATSNNLCDNWLICPHVLVAQQTSLFYTCMGSLADSMAVVAITGNGDTLVLNDDLYTQASTEERRVDLTPFAGSVIRLGFHHHACGVFGVLRLLSVRIDHLEGIDNVFSPDFSVLTAGLDVTVSGAPEGQMSLYDIMGRRVLSSPTSNGTFRLPATGVYIIRIGELCRKVVVR